MEIQMAILMQWRCEHIMRNIVFCTCDIHINNGLAGMFDVGEMEDVRFLGSMASIQQSLRVGNS